MFCLTTLSVVFTLVLSSPDGTKWSPINFTPIKMGPVKKRLTIVLDINDSQIHSSIHIPLYSKASIPMESPSLIFFAASSNHLPYFHLSSRLCNAMAFSFRKKQSETKKGKTYLTQIFVNLLTVVWYPVLASSPRRLAYLSKKMSNM